MSIADKLTVAKTVISFQTETDINKFSAETDLTSDVFGYNLDPAELFYLIQTVLSSFNISFDSNVKNINILYNQKLFIIKNLITYQSN